MILTIWRHGAAGDATTDFERELTARGKDDVSFGSQRFHELCLRKSLAAPDRIIHSPWERTAQTAEIISGIFSRARLEASDLIGSGAPLADAHTLLDATFSEAGEADHVVLVSHQPLVSRLVAALLGNDAGVPGLSPGGLATLALYSSGPDSAQLLFWALPPLYESDA